MAIAHHIVKLRSHLIHVFIFLHMTAAADMGDTVRTAREDKGENPLENQLVTLKMYFR